jgi:hypothetical protein
MAFVIFRYYRILAVGLKFAGGSGGMAPKAQGQGQVSQKASAPAPGAFSGGTAQAPQGGARRDLPRGRDWYVRSRTYNGREYYDLVAQPGVRGVVEILKEALPKVHEWVSKQPDSRIMVSFTMFLGRSRKRSDGKMVYPQIKLLVGKGGVAVQIPHPVIIGRMWDLLRIAEEVNKQISPHDLSDDGREYDDFNPPDADEVA